ncbi:MAG TPA: hypothetical protein VJW17_05950 [Pyrinomonadaceae bacterium]|jgi:hypothetical protein|nr:hypothetical protein [Pyrinomonadaceae bacterium]
MEKLLQDIRFGSRQFIKQPSFAALAIVSMALGIGANTSIFSLVDTTLLRRLAVNDPSQIGRALQHDEQGRRLGPAVVSNAKITAIATPSSLVYLSTAMSSAV